MIKKIYKILIPVIISFTIILSLVLIYLPSNNTFLVNYEKKLEFNSVNSYSFIQDQLNLGFRIPGTQESLNCVNYFESKFEEIDNNFTYVIHNFTIHLTECQNVLFKLNEDYSNIIILGAHYDSRAKATKDPIIANRNNPVPGANDGASGCAVLIELARILYLVRENLSCQIWFLFFDAEDQGYDYAAGIEGWDWCEGSRAFVNSINSFYNSSHEFFDCMILLDMVGGENLQFINEQYSTSSLLNELFEIGRQLGYTTQFPTEPYSARITDDHVSFINYGIPSADLIIKFWNNPDWPYHHTIEDDLSHISNLSLNITGKTIEQFIYNNYFDVPSNNYQGNYPWKEDINLLDTDVLITLIVMCALIGVSFLLILSIKWISKRYKKNLNFS